MTIELVPKEDVIKRKLNDSEKSYKSHTTGKFKDTEQHNK